MFPLSAGRGYRQLADIFKDKALIDQDCYNSMLDPYKIGDGDIIDSIFIKIDSLNKFLVGVHTYLDFFNVEQDIINKIDDNKITVRELNASNKEKILKEYGNKLNDLKNANNMGDVWQYMHTEYLFVFDYVFPGIFTIDCFTLDPLEFISHYGICYRCEEMFIEYVFNKIRVEKSIILNNNNNNYKILFCYFFNCKIMGKQNLFLKVRL